MENKINVDGEALTRERGTYYSELGRFDTWVCEERNCEEAALRLRDASADHWHATASLDGEWSGLCLLRVAKTELAALGSVIEARRAIEDLLGTVSLARAERT